jgi:hypothetical protein
MTHPKLESTLTLVLVCIAMAGAQASRAAEKADAKAPPAVQPAAMAALDKMGKYLRTLKAFQVSAATSTDAVTDDGQIVESDTVSDLLVQAPNHLRIEITSDDQHRMYFYDGKSLTVWAELVNYYATAPAPPTIIQLADDLNDKYGISLPLEDLFSWGTPRSSVAQITVATDFGPSQVLGVTCEQYGFRQPGLDWQIWIQNGDYPLPRKVVLTTTSDPARPKHRAVLSWNLAPSFDDSAFTFVPPKDAHKIVLAEYRAAAASDDKKK